MLTTWGMSIIIGWMFTAGYIGYLHVEHPKKKCGKFALAGFIGSLALPIVFLLAGSYLYGPKITKELQKRYKGK